MDNAPVKRKRAGKGIFILNPTLAYLQTHGSTFSATHMTTITKIGYHYSTIYNKEWREKKI